MGERFKEWQCKWAVRGHWQGGSYEIHIGSYPWRWMAWIVADLNMRHDAWIEKTRNKPNDQ